MARENPGKSTISSAISPAKRPIKANWSRRERLGPVFRSNLPRVRKSSCSLGERKPSAYQRHEPFHPIPSHSLSPNVNTAEPAGTDTYCFPSTSNVTGPAVTCPPTTPFHSIAPLRASSA